MERQFPMVYGWQNSLLCQSSFCPVVDESIQIHFTRQNHWVCSTSIGGYLRVYDSAGSKRLNASMEAQLAEIYKSLVQGNHLEVELPPVQIQNGELDCGVFAIAFAYDLAAGNDPTQVRYDQSKMREHLARCLSNQSFSLFPRQQMCKNVKFRKDFAFCDIELFCRCLMPETWDDMIECDLCDKWLHMKCENLDTLPFEQEWLCKDCRPPSPKRLRCR